LGAGAASAGVREGSAYANRARESGSGPDGSSAGGSGGPTGLRPAAPPVPSVPPEQDVPEADDPDLDDSGLTGIALLERDLGARVIGEFDSA
jgi:DNA polymerase-3 subunit gamma/tau